MFVARAWHVEKSFFVFAMSKRVCFVIFFIQIEKEWQKPHATQHDKNPVNSQTAAEHLWEDFNTCLYLIINPFEKFHEQSSASYIMNLTPFFIFIWRFMEFKIGCFNVKSILVVVYMNECWSAFCMGLNMQVDTVWIHQRHLMNSKCEKIMHKNA